MEFIKASPIKQAISQVTKLGIMVTYALIIWKALMCFTGSESPVVVVLSESMEPGFQRGFQTYSTSVFKDNLYYLEYYPLETVEVKGTGVIFQGDLLLLVMSNDPIRSGEIVVYEVEGRPIPIVHRVIKVHERRGTGEVDVLTKGDNNDNDDRILYAQGQLWLQQRHIVGRAVGFIPYVGWASIILQENPTVKYILIGALVVLLITSKD